ncbi:MAG TPA: Maf family protein [Anaerolineales bacterium]|nr:Maf family protein [Anaerolineales bacterium]
MVERTLILLASNSPRRRKLIALGNWMFSAAASDVDESVRPGEAPADYVLRLAEEKARTAMTKARLEHIIVAADTTVVDANKILGKPEDMREAIEMLKGLRGHSHQVYTGLAMLRMSDRQLLTDLCITDVPMRNYSDEEINAYVMTGDPLDKAGAYAIQSAFQPVENLKGCFASVMGLPMCHLVRLLAKIGITPNADVPANCQTYLEYKCPVSAAILHGEQVG